MSDIELRPMTGLAPGAGLRLPLMRQIGRALRAIVAPPAPAAARGLSLSDRLDRRAEAEASGFSLFHAAPLARTDVILCGRWDFATRRILDEGAALARSRTILPSVDAIVPALRASAAERQLLLLQIDGMEAPVEMLVSIRAQFPNAAVILLSKEFARNDLTGERRVICDASLKDPTTRVSFAMALTAAFDNHAEYRARRLL